MGEERSPEDSEVAHRALRDLLETVGLPQVEAGCGVSFTGHDPMVPSRHRLATAAAAALAAQGVAISEISGKTQDVSVDGTHCSAFIPRSWSR